MRALHHLHQPVMAGIDIGNGWSQAVTNIHADPIVFQSTAAPASSVGDSLMGAEAPTPVVVNGKPWLVGLPPRLIGHAQAIHKGACLSDEHHALFLEALSRIGRDIDFLVVGMTCDQIGDKDKVKNLKDKFTGTHNAGGKEIRVARVGVRSQPIGTARLYIESIIEEIEEQTFLVIDIGEGTTDITKVHVAIADDNGLMVSEDPSGTMSEWLGMSQVCEAMAEQIGGKPGDISRRFRSGSIEAYQSVVSPIAERLTTAIKARLRSIDDVDRIIMTGGGAHVLGDALAAGFDGKQVNIMPDAALANARGFLLAAQDFGGRR